MNTRRHEGPEDQGECPASGGVKRGGTLPARGSREAGPDVLRDGPVDEGVRGRALRG